MFQYALEDTSGKLDLAQLRELQDFTIRPALQAVSGVGEVASFGGFGRQYQIVLDPNRLAAYGLSLGEPNLTIWLPASMDGAIRADGGDAGAHGVWVMPLTLLLVIFLLRQGMRGWAQTSLVLTSLPFALIGSVWLLYTQDYNVSTAVWVGLIAVIGTASETGILMVEFLDQSLALRQQTNASLTLDDVNEAVIDGAAMRVRPIVMSVASTVLGLLPLLWEAGPGADVSARIAAPVVGGLVSCFVLTLLVVPAAYTVWRRRQVRRGGIVDAAEATS